MVPEKQQQGILQMILGKSSKRELTKAYGHLSLEKVIEGNYPSLAKLRKTYGDEKTETIASIMILDTATFFESNMNEEAAMDIAAEIATTHYYLTLEDLFMVLQDLKQQEIYGKLTANKILVACKKHSEKRMQTAANINYNKHLQNKEGRTDEERLQDPAFLEFYHEYEKKKMEKTATNEEKSKKVK